MIPSTASTAARGRVRVEQGAKQVRVAFNGQVIADAKRPAYLWESPYHLPVADVQPGVLRSGDVDGEPVA